MIRAVLLCEDSLGDRGSDSFGLARLFMAMLSDHLADRSAEVANSDLAGEPYLLHKQVHIIPCKSNNRVVALCRQQGPKFTSTGARLFLVLDRDRAPELLGQSRDASGALLRSALLQSSCAPPGTVVCWIQRNIETIVRHVDECGRAVGQPVQEELVRLALSKNRNARDAVLIHAGKPEHRPLRTCVGRHHPELIALVEEVAGLLISPGR